VLSAAESYARRKVVQPRGCLSLGILAAIRRLNPAAAGVLIKGKGGKIQYQRILPSDIAFVRSYFEEKDADEYLFTREEMENKIDLHHLRACQAKRAYLYY